MRCPRCMHEQSSVTGDLCTNCGSTTISNGDNVSVAKPSRLNTMVMEKPQVQDSKERPPGSPLEEDIREWLLAKRCGLWAQFYLGDDDGVDDAVRFVADLVTRFGEPVATVPLPPKG